jgi:hypothetical protein
MGLDQSFIDFFWTWRFSHLPLFRLVDAVIPRAAVYHSISTGYAGLLAALAKLRTGSPLLITEQLKLFTQFAAGHLELFLENLFIKNHLHACKATQGQKNERA